MSFDQCPSCVNFFLNIEFQRSMGVFKKSKLYICFVQNVFNDKMLTKLFITIKNKDCVTT